MPEETPDLLHTVEVNVFAPSHKAAAKAVWDGLGDKSPGSPFQSVVHTKLYGTTCKACLEERPMNTEVNGVLTPPEVPHMGESRERAMELAISHHAARGTGGISQVIKAADAIQTYLATGTVPENGDS